MAVRRFFAEGETKKIFVYPEWMGLNRIRKNTKKVFEVHTESGQPFSGVRVEVYGPGEFVCDEGWTTGWFQTQAEVMLLEDADP